MNAVDLHWIPLGAGQRVVKYSGRLYEAAVAGWARRPRADLYHTALIITADSTPVWGRDELRAGEMWNSNSVTSWLLARCGTDMARLHPPPGGRAPGWDAGLCVAARSAAVSPP